MRIKELYIFSIQINASPDFKVVELDCPSKVKYIEVGLVFFMENYLRNNNHNFWQNNSSSLYILRDSNYSDIKEIFTKIQDTEVKVVRGSGQKSHIVSPIDFRLSCYLMALSDMNYNKFNLENSWNCAKKDRYLPSY